MNERIAQIKLALEGKIKCETVEDLISCVPVFEFEAEKKLFSKKTYNELPKGFELKKNIHIKYFQRDEINIIFEVCAASEVYDFVKTEYYSSKLEEAKKELIAACKTNLKEKYADYLFFSGGEKSDVFKIFDEELKLFYPLESYTSYTAYAQTPVYESKLQRVNYAKKEQSFYYQPFADKEFQIVFQPVITEPCIQLIYKAELTISLKPQCCEKTEK
jgi:hypothetical protein